MDTESMKKILALVVALLLVFAAAGPAQAAVHTPTPPTVVDNGCGVPKTFTAPTSTASITYQVFPQTSTGTYKVVATVAQGDTFNLAGTGYVVTPIAPYRAEWQMQIVTPCPVTEPPAQHRPWWKVWRDWFRDCWKQWHRR
jgi:hypothetical protein